MEIHIIEDGKNDLLCNTNALRNDKNKKELNTRSHSITLEGRKTIYSETVS